MTDPEGGLSMWAVPQGGPVEGWAELEENGWGALIGRASGPENPPARSRSRGQRRGGFRWFVRLPSQFSTWEELRAAATESRPSSVG